MTEILTSDVSVDTPDCTFRIEFVNMPRNAGHNRILNLKSDHRTKQCIIQIKNHYNLCAPKAIITGLTYFDGLILDKRLTKSQIKHVRDGCDLQRKLAWELCERLSEYNKKSFTLEDVKNCEKVHV